MRQETFRWLCDRPSIQWCFKTFFFEPIASTPPTLVAKGATPYQHWGCPSCRQRNHTLPKLFFAKNNHLSPGHAQSLGKKQHMMLETLAGIVCFAQLLTFFSTPPIGMFWDSTSNSAFFYTGKVIFSPEFPFLHCKCHFFTGNAGVRHNPATFPRSHRPKNEGSKNAARAKSIHGVPAPKFSIPIWCTFRDPPVRGGLPTPPPFPLRELSKKI